MKKLLIILSLVTVAGAMGCNKNEDFASTPAICNQQPVVTPYQNNQQPNCMPYNPSAYSNTIPGGFYGCPFGYVPLQTGYEGTGGMTCVSEMIVRNAYAPNNFVFPGNNPTIPSYMGPGPLQQCDSYNPNNACGSNGLRCIANNGRYGFCGQ